MFIVTRNVYIYIVCLVAQSRRLFANNNHTDCCLLGSPVHAILQVRIPEWVAISSSRGSS